MTSNRSESSSLQRAAISAARSNRPSGVTSRAALRPARAGGAVQPGSNRAAPARGSSPRILVALLGEVARRGDPELLRAGNVERAGGVRAAEPLLARQRIEVEGRCVDRDRARRLRP